MSPSLVDTPRGFATDGPQEQEPALDVQPSQQEIDLQAARFSDQLSRDFNYSSQRSPHEEWSVTEPTIYGYRQSVEESSFAVPGIEGRDTQIVVGRMEFLMDRAVNGETPAERDQALEKLATSFDTEPDLDRIQKEYREFRNQIESIADSVSSSIGQNDSYERLRALEDRIEQNNEQIEYIEENASSTPGGRRALRSLESQNRRLERQLDRIDNRMAGGEPGRIERSRIGRAQDAVLETIADRGRQELPGGIDIEALFKNSSALAYALDTNSLDKRLFAPRDEYIREVAETRATIAARREAKEARRMQTVSLQDKPAIGDEFLPPSSQYIDHTGKDREYQLRESTRAADAELEKFFEKTKAEGEAYRETLNQRALQTASVLWQTVNSDGDITQRLDRMTDQERGLVYSKIADAVQDPANRNNRTLLKLVDQLNTYIEGSRQEQTRPDRGDVRAGDLARAVREVASQQDNLHERVQNLSPEQRVSVQKPGVQLDKQINDRRRAPAQPNRDGLQGRELASEVWKAASKGADVQALVQNLSPEQQASLLANVEAARTNPRYANDIHLMRMRVALADVGVV